MKTTNKDYIAEVEKMKPALREFYWLISKNKLTEDEFVKDMAHRLELALLQASKRACEDLMLEEKTNEDFMKELKVESSDWSHGHSRGYNQAIKNLKAKIKQYLESL